jgi:hypothetical protein
MSQGRQERPSTRRLRTQRHTRHLLTKIRYQGRNIRRVRLLFRYLGTAECTANPCPPLSRFGEDGTDYTGIFERKLVSEGGNVGRQSW